MSNRNRKGFNEAEAVMPRKGEVAPHLAPPAPTLQ